MLSICLPSRKKDNLSSKLDAFLDSIVLHTSPEEQKQVEIILKFDDDDEIPDYVINNKYPFEIKYVQYARGAGRYAAHDSLNYLNTLRNLKTRFIFNPSDDFIFTRPFVTEILSQDSTYRILGGGTGMSACCVFKKEWCKCPVIPDPISLPLGANHRDRPSWGDTIRVYCPIYGVDILKSVSNPGLFSSTDAYFIALPLALYKMYGINIWRDMKSFYYRNESDHYIHNYPEHLKSVTNYNRLDFMQHHGYNAIVWDIIESHARNIYLNMKEDKLI